MKKFTDAKELDDFLVEIRDREWRTLSEFRVFHIRCVPENFVQEEETIIDFYKSFNILEFKDVAWLIAMLLKLYSNVEVECIEPKY